MIINMSGTEIICQKSNLDGSNRNTWKKMYEATASTPDGDWWDGDEVSVLAPTQL